MPYVPNVYFAIKLRIFDNKNICLYSKLRFATDSREIDGRPNRRSSNCGLASKNRHRPVFRFFAHPYHQVTVVKLIHITTVQTHVNSGSLMARSHRKSSGTLQQTKCCCYSGFRTKCYLDKLPINWFRYGSLHPSFQAESLSLTV